MRTLTVSALYVLILSCIYQAEIAVYWQYMRFEASFDALAFFVLAVSAVMLSLFLPTQRDTRAYLLTSLHYLFFLPSLVYMAFNDVEVDYVLAFFLCAAIVYSGSAVQITRIKGMAVRRTQVYALVTTLILFVIILKVVFGGLTSFNLNPEMVYEYRSETASRMPAGFAYLYSNVANVLIPGSIALALVYRRRALALVGLLSGVLLFAMAHHKSILFSTLLVFLMFGILMRYRSPAAIAIIPFAMVFVSAFEIIWLHAGGEFDSPGIITSYLVRRALLVPPMIDAAYVELFNDAPKYLWSTSRLGLGIASNAYDSAAPFVVGRELFNDPAMSANAGIIGSGYANAGIVGSIVYAAVMALVISFTNSVGRKAGPELIAILSLPTILIIFTSTDLTTALLTHGLILLLVFISILPDEAAEKTVGKVPITR